MYVLPCSCGLRVCTRVLTREKDHHVRKRLPENIDKRPLHSTAYMYAHMHIHLYTIYYRANELGDIPLYRAWSL